MSVSSVWATDYSTTESNNYGSYTSTATKKIWDFSTATTQQQLQNNGDTFNDSIQYVSGYVKVKTNPKCLSIGDSNNAGVIKVPVPDTTKGGVITVTTSSSDVKKYLLIGNDDNRKISSKNSNSLTQKYTTSDITDGYITLSSGTSEFKLTTLTLSPIVEKTSKTAVCSNISDANTTPEYYAVSVISDFDANKDKTSFAQTNSSGAITGTTSNSVYKSVSIGGNTYKPSDFGGDDDNDYLFASVISDVPDDVVLSTMISNIKNLGYTFQQ
jgi:hypothetical protein